MMKIAEKIYRLRTEHDMTQSQLAKIAGVSDKAVSAWEAGTRDPKIKSIQGICSHFGIDINRFIDEDTNDYSCLLYTSSAPQSGAVSGRASVFAAASVARAGAGTSERFVSVFVCSHGIHA